MNKSSLNGYLGAAALLLLLWQAFSLWAGPLLVPSPAQTGHALLREAAARTFWLQVGASTWRIAASLVVATVLAVPLGIALGGSRRLCRWSAPLIYLTYPVPKIVFLPLILLVFGLGDGSKIFLIALIMFFQLLITTRDAARQITKEMRYSLKSLGGNRIDFFWHVLWPFCLPGIFTSLRVSVGTAVAVLFFAESIGAERGLGLYILNAWGMADAERMFVGIVSLSLLGVLFYEFFDILERRYCRWKDL